LFARSTAPASRRLRTFESLWWPPGAGREDGQPRPVVIAEVGRPACEVAAQLVEQERGQLEVAQAGLGLRLTDPEAPPVDI